MRGLITTNFSAAHPAIDIATANGTPIVAAQSGLVYYASWSPYGYGNFVQIEHGDGRQTHYAHLRAFNVKPGDFVQQGQLIGWEGSTGNSTGPHLHFELVIQGRYVDPLLYRPTK
jgi:murein DD-endopeptidase MepM/ murein hydrolase activator NlpD